MRFDEDADTLTVTNTCEHEVNLTFTFPQKVVIFDVPAQQTITKLSDEFNV